MLSSTRHLNLYTYKSVCYGLLVQQVQIYGTARLLVMVTAIFFEFKLDERASGAVIDRSTAFRRNESMTGHWPGLGQSK